MTVNKKRKKLEKQGLLKYYTSLDTSEQGAGTLIAKNLYTIKFKIGITKDQFLEAIEKDKTIREFNASYISSSYLGEKDGHLALIIILEAISESGLLEEFNSKLIPFIRKKLGENAVEEVIASKIIQPIRVHHNYLPYMNMENGKIIKDWSDEWIFVQEVIENNQ